MAPRSAGGRGVGRADASHRFQPEPQAWPCRPRPSCRHGVQPPPRLARPALGRLWVQDPVVQGLPDRAWRSRMAAMVFSAPVPRFGQCCMSMSNTRSSNRARPIGWGRAWTGRICSARRPLQLPLW